MQLRLVVQSDCEIITDLWNSCALFDSISTDLLSEKIWEDPDCDEALNLVAEEDDTPIGIGVGVLRRRNGRNVGYVKLLAIDPSYQGRGLGREVLLNLEKRLADRGADFIRPGEAAPNYLFPGVDVRYTRATLMFNECGYEQIGETYNLRADLDNLDMDTEEQIAKLAGKGFEIRRFCVEDSGMLERLIDSQWPAWNAEVFTAKSNGPPSLFIAVKDYAVVGFAAYDSNNLGTGSFGPMGTHPDYRGIGVGEVLLKLCLNDIRDQGHSAAIIPWVGPIKFYARHANARIDRVFRRYEKTL